MSVTRQTKGTEMDTKIALLKAVDTLSLLRTNLMGMAKICESMEITTGEKVWPTLYNTTMCLANMAEEPKADLMAAVAQLQQAEEEDRRKFEKAWLAPDID